MGRDSCLPTQLQKLHWHTATVDVPPTYHDLMQNDATGIFTTIAGFHGAKAAFPYVVTNLTLKGSPWAKKRTHFRVAVMRDLTPPFIRMLYFSI